MWKISFIFVLAIVYCKADGPINTNRSPYPASGYRPVRPFHLPPTYLPPATQQGYYEISPQRVDYAGSQIYRQSDKNYPMFNQQQPNLVNIQRHNDYYRNYPGKSTLMYPTANNNIVDFRFTQQQQQQRQQPFNTFGDFEEKETSNILNAAIQYYNKLQDNNDLPNITKGKYFVLTPDNTIQQVMYTTTQDETEAKTNDFKAQLKYSKIGELHDPLYKYNQHGQLVRLVK